MKRQLKNAAGILGLTLFVAGGAMAEPTVKLGGLLKFQAVSISNDGFTNGKSITDLQVRKAQLDANASINPTLYATMVMLYEEGDPSRQFKIDEAFLERKLMDGQLNMRLGYKVIPFGTFATKMVSDPLTLKLAEAREDALIATYSNGGFSGSFYLFNGDKDKAADTAAPAKNSLDGMGIQLQYEMKSDSYGLVLTGGYLSDMAEPDGNTVITTGYAGDEVPGMALGAEATFGNLSVFAEHIAASKAFGSTTLTFNGKGATPTATVVEMGYKMERIQTSLGYQMTGEATALSLPATRTMLTVGYEMEPECMIALEYMNNQDYATSEGGSGLASTQFTLEWTATF